MKCYQCGKETAYLFDDSRCGKCTRLTPEEVTGEIDVMESVLQMIKDSNVVSFKMSEDKKTIRLKEQCDHYYRAELNKTGLGKMIDELQDLYDQMEHGE